jgi:hypothetical protein
MSDTELDDGYRVGYGKPPKETQFKKGQSGNSRGRRKGSKNSGTLLTNELDEVLPIKERGRSKVITKRAAIYKHMVNKAVSGDIRAIRLILENIEKLETQYPERFVADAELERQRLKQLIKMLTQDERRQYLDLMRTAKDLFSTAEQRVREKIAASPHVKLPS